LDETLQEEKAANDTLTDVAAEILESAASGESDREEDVETAGTSATPRTGAGKIGNGSRRSTSPKNGAR
jgi:hypothetical protein